jgi:hypothetical protein
MDDQASTKTKAALLVTGGAVLAAVPAQRVFGDAGVRTVLLLGLVAVAALAWCELTGRPLPRLTRGGRRSAPAAPAVEDPWRSERWIREAVDRGLRALDEWRLEQREV